MLSFIGTPLHSLESEPVDPSIEDSCLVPVWKVFLAPCYFRLLDSGKLHSVLKRNVEEIEDKTMWSLLRTYQHGLLFVCC